MLKECVLCPMMCKVNREEGAVGRCKAGKLPKLALASIHNFEEPCISGKNGSGTVFFSNCNLGCVFCQNYKISHDGVGKEISIEKLAEIFVNQQKKGVHNINLVSPTIYVPQIIEAIDIAKTMGLNIPIIYNSSGYERVETIQKLNGYIDIYMPDFKYAEDELGKKYSHVENYSKYAKSSILEMIKQVGKPQFENGIMKKGVIIRHLILPNHIKNTIKVLDWIKENIQDNAIISIMAQYFPTGDSYKTDLNRKITKREYQKVEDYLFELELKNGYIQGLEKNEEIYVPNFDLSNIE